MKLADKHELLESVLVELNLVVSSAGVLIELARRGESYTLLETAPSTGNRLLKFTSQDPRLVAELFLSETGAAGAPGRRI